MPRIVAAKEMFRRKVKNNLSVFGAWKCFLLKLSSFLLDGAAIVQLGFLALGGMEPYTLGAHRKNL